MYFVSSFPRSCATMSNAQRILKGGLLGKGCNGSVVHEGTFDSIQVAVKYVAKCSDLVEGLLVLNHDNVVRIHHIEETDYIR